MAIYFTTYIKFNVVLSKIWKNS